MTRLRMGVVACSSAARIALAAIAAVGSGCNLVLGLDGGKPLADAAVPDSTTAGADAGGSAAAPDATPEAGETETGPLRDGQTQDAEGSAPASADASDACTSDPSWCSLHCGTGPDNCGRSRVCDPECAVGYACGPLNLCECESCNTAPPTQDGGEESGPDAGADAE